MKRLPESIQTEIEARNQTILRRFLVERKTYQAIGDEFCLTRERIRQILLRIGLDARWIREIEQEASQMSIPNVSLKVREIIAAYFENKED